MRSGYRRARRGYLGREVPPKFFLTSIPRFWGLAEPASVHTRARLPRVLSEMKPSKVRDALEVRVPEPRGEERELKGELDSRGFFPDGKEVSEGLAKMHEAGLIEADLLATADGFATVSTDDFSTVGLPPPTFRN